MHFVFAQLDDWVDVSAFVAPTYQAVQAKLRAAVREAKQGERVRAQGFDPSITSGARVPTLAELDALATDQPFFMLESNGHVAYVNSRALQLAGIDRDTPDLATGRFQRDSNGALTGRIEETAAVVPFIRKMPLASAAEMRTRVRRTFGRAAAAGCRPSTIAGSG